MSNKLERHCVDSENKDTAYIATVLLFNNVRKMAMHKIGGWKLYESFTGSEQCITEYRNGKMFVRAVSGENSHLYSFGGLQ